MRAVRSDTPIRSIDITALAHEKLERTFAAIRYALGEPDRTVTIDEEENGDICLRVFKTPPPEKE